MMDFYQKLTKSKSPERNVKIINIVSVGFIWIFKFETFSKKSLPYENAVLSRICLFLKAAKRVQIGENHGKPNEIDLS
jgi:hypothetical protein